MGSAVISRNKLAADKATSQADAHRWNDAVGNAFVSDCDLATHYWRVVHNTSEMEQDRRVSRSCGACSSTLMMRAKLRCTSGRARSE
jgi:hypothetical protein